MVHKGTAAAKIPITNKQTAEPNRLSTYPLCTPRWQSETAIYYSFEERSSPKIKSTDEIAKTFWINALPYMKYNLERDEILCILLFLYTIWVF